MGAKLGWDEDEELFGRVPVGFGPEGPAISESRLTQKAAAASAQKARSWRLPAVRLYVIG